MPDEWYRRSKSRNVSPAAGPSELTLKRLASLEESEEDEEEEGEGTAKAGDRINSPPRPNSAKTIEQRGLVTQGRLSSIFDGWLQSSPTSSSRSSTAFSTDSRKSVSEPKLVERAAPTNLEGKSLLSISDDEGEEDFEADFEDMLVSLLDPLLFTRY